MRKLIIVFGLFISIIANINAQNQKEFFVIPSGDSLAIYLTFSPRPNVVYDVYRKTDSGYVKVNRESIRPELDVNLAKIKLSNEWQYLSTSLNTDNEMEILRAIRRNDLTAGLFSLISPKIAETAGRLSYDSGITLGKSYSYKIIFSSVSGVKKDSLEKTVETKLIIPTAPIKLVAENINNKILLTWDYPVWKGNYSDLAFNYNVYRKDETGKFNKVNKEIIVRNSNNAPTYDDIWLDLGSTYSYYTTISDPQGNESKPSKTVKIKLDDVVAPKALSNIESNSSTKGIVLSWNMSAELDAAGYNVYRSYVIKGKSIKLNKKLIQVDIPYFEDSTVMINKQYFYSVTAVDTAKNESKKSNAHSQIWVDLFPPLPPNAFSAKPEKGFIKLNWKKTESKDIIGYILYRGLDSTLTPRLIEEPIAQTTFVDSGFKSAGFNHGATLHYFVSTIDSSRNESDRIYVKVEVPDIQPPALPTNFRVENNNGIYATVSSNISISGDAVKYSIYKKDEKGKLALLSEFDKAPISLRDSSVQKGNKYFYAISVIDSVGNKSEISKEVEVFVKDSNPPPSPRNIRAKLINGKVNLSWGEVIDFDFVGYNIYRSDSPSGTYILLNKEPITKLTFVDNSGNKKMFYRIKSIDTSDNESKYEKNIAVK